MLELKAEVEERADRKVYPVSRLEPAEVREDLGEILLGRCGGGEEPRGANGNDAKKMSSHRSSPLAELR